MPEYPRHQPPHERRCSLETSAFPAVDRVEKGHDLFPPATVRPRPAAGGRPISAAVEPQHVEQGVDAHDTHAVLRAASRFRFCRRPSSAKPSSARAPLAACPAVARPAPSSARRLDDPRRRPARRAPRADRGRQPPHRRGSRSRRSPPPGRLPPAQRLVATPSPARIGVPIESRRIVARTSGRPLDRRRPRRRPCGRPPAAARRPARTRGGSCPGRMPRVVPQEMSTLRSRSSTEMIRPSMPSMRSSFGVEASTAPAAAVGDAQRGEQGVLFLDGRGPLPHLVVEHARLVLRRLLGVNSFCRAAEVLLAAGDLLRQEFEPLRPLLRRPLGSGAFRLLASWPLQRSVEDFLSCCCRTAWPDFACAAAICGSAPACGPIVAVSSAALVFFAAAFTSGPCGGTRTAARRPSRP